MFANLFNLTFSASPVSFVWVALQAYPRNPHSVSIGREVLLLVATLKQHHGVSVVHEKLIQTGGVSRQN